MYSTRLLMAVPVTAGIAVVDLRAMVVVLAVVAVLAVLLAARAIRMASLRRQAGDGGER